MSIVAIRGGRVIDPANGVDSTGTVVFTDGRIVSSDSPYVADASAQIIDATGLIVCPGLVDAHVHLRDPGLTYKEDLYSGARAAAAGGFVRMCCMPNTKPVLDNPAIVNEVRERGRKTGIHIHPIGAISEKQEGLKLAPLRQMAEAGAIGFSDDGISTKSSQVMRQALEYSIDLNLPIMVHCEDPEMASLGSMHQGSVSRELGDPGIPALAEESYIQRDIELAADTGGWLHVLHVSTVRGAEMIRKAKADGVRVTAEVMPHHLALTDEWVAGRRRFAGEKERFDLGRVDPNAKVNPPLRPESDALGLIEYVLDGTIDFIATDHAPHSVLDKPPVLSEAAFGMSGLEVALPALQRVVERGDLDWSLVVDLLTRRPCQTLNLPGGRLTAGDPADITLIDPSLSWTISETSLVSRSKNTPLLGMTVTGRAVVTIVGGKVLHDVRS